ncbi:hypothetical protein [Bacilliculturomica massiliensis]|uniref:hypothetical protein n=1 Tax=Bacilliculturomica massiliensis TaxID=1917867 RepID=UPI0013EF2553|nr:hypothetical protein [Bacilliculturomica massiliensis]
MKQIIVLVSMVILGIAIAGMVFSFKAPAQQITDAAVNGIESAVSDDAMNKAGK